jgi:hypothetical protein
MRYVLPSNWTSLGAAVNSAMLNMEMFESLGMERMKRERDSAPPDPSLPSSHHAGAATVPVWSTQSKSTLNSSSTFWPGLMSRFSM